MLKKHIKPNGSSLNPSYCGIFSRFTESSFTQKKLENILEYIKNCTIIFPFSAASCTWGLKMGNQQEGGETEKRNKNYVGARKKPCRVVAKKGKRTSKPKRNTDKICTQQAEELARLSLFLYFFLARNFRFFCGSYRVIVCT